MSGLDKIIDSILTDADEVSAKILRDADLKAQTIEADGKAAAQAAYDKAMEKVEASAARQIEAAKSGAAAESARDMLRFKVTAVREVLDEALAALRALPEEEYFSLCLKWIGENLSEGEGVVSFGKKDLERLPKDFEKRLAALCPPPGLTLSREAADITDGLILRYGDIEYDLTFEAVMEERGDELRDLVAERLFG